MRAIIGRSRPIAWRLPLGVSPRPPPSLPWKRKQACSQSIITRRESCQSPAWPPCVVPTLLGGARALGGQPRAGQGRDDAPTRRKRWSPLPLPSRRALCRGVKPCSHPRAFLLLLPRLKGAGGQPGLLGRCPVLRAQRGVPQRFPARAGTS